MSRVQSPEGALSYFRRAPDTGNSTSLKRHRNHTCPYISDHTMRPKFFGGAGLRPREGLFLSPELHDVVLHNSCPQGRLRMDVKYKLKKKKKNTHVYIYANHLRVIRRRKAKSCQAFGKDASINIINQSTGLRL